VRRFSGKNSDGWTDFQRDTEPAFRMAFREGRERANIRGGTLADAELQNVDLRNAIFEGTIFLDAIWRMPISEGHPASMRFPKRNFVAKRFHRCGIAQEQFSALPALRCKLFRSASAGCYVPRCQYARLRLYEARMTSAILRTQIELLLFQPCTLSECCFTEADMRKCNFLLARMNACVL